MKDFTRFPGDVLPSASILNNTALTWSLQFWTRWLGDTTTTLNDAVTKTDELYTKPDAERQIHGTDSLTWAE
jgi:hypothetical protein